MQDLHTKPPLKIEDYRTDMNHYWTRLMWYRDELWRVTTPIFAAYGAFIITLLGYLFTKETTLSAPMIINMLFLLVMVTFIMIRLYFIYSSRIYEGIKYLNYAIEIREQRIYRKFDFFSEPDDEKTHFESNYRKFKVFPELNVLFGIIVMLMSGIIALILLSMLQQPKPLNLDVSNLFVIVVAVGATGMFELHIKSYTIPCDKEITRDKQNSETSNTQGTSK